MELGDKDERYSALTGMGLLAFWTLVFLLFSWLMSLMTRCSNPIKPERAAYNFYQIDKINLSNDGYYQYITDRSIKYYKNKFAPANLPACSDWLIVSEKGLKIKAYKNDKFYKSIPPIAGKVRIKLKNPDNSIYYEIEPEDNLFTIMYKPYGRRK